MPVKSELRAALPATRALKGRQHALTARLLASISG